MKKGFENEFMNIQSGLISLCLEAVSMAVEEVYAYAYIGEGSSLFNVFYRYKGSIIQANKVMDNKVLIQVLKLGTQDLEKLRKICKEYDTKCPVEMKMYYNCISKKYHADCKYDLREYYTIHESPADHFLSWRDEVSKLR